MPPDDRDFQFGSLAIKLGLIEQAQLRAALAALSEHHLAGKRQSLGQILMERGALTADQVRQVLAEQGKELMVCGGPDCDARYNVLGYDASKRYKCKRCGAQLRPASPNEETVRVEAEIGDSAVCQTLGGREERTFDESGPTLREMIEDAGLRLDIDPDGATVIDGAGVSGQALEAVARLGRYPVTGHLGAGGMGEVLQVRDEEVGREMAAKVVLGQADARTLNKFILEAQITGQLEHPNIVPMHELGMTPDRRIYFTMKRVQGDDLARLLEVERQSCGSLSARDSGVRPSSRRMAVDRATARNRSRIKFLDIFLKICDAMAFAHSRGVIHRDLKPANVMVGKFGEVQVMDWGLAKVVGKPDQVAEECTIDLGGGRVAELARRKGAQQPLKTLAGSVMGTPAYMPPEQARGEIDKLDERADVYALGAILYEMMTLEPPYTGDNPWNLVHQVIEGDLRPPSERTPEREVPWEIEAVVMQAMSPVRSNRYKNVRALRRDIEAWLEGRTLGAARYSALQMLGKWILRHRFACSLAAAVLLSLLAFLGWQHWTEHREILNSLKEARTSAREGKLGEAVRQYSRLVAKVPHHRQARTELVASYRKLASSQIAGHPHARDLRARWTRRQETLLDGRPARPETDKARRHREATVAAYLSASATLDRGLSLAPDSAELRALREEAGRALGWAALLGRDYTLAKAAFSQLGIAVLAKREVRDLIGHVEQDRNRRLKHWRRRVASMVVDFRQGLDRRERGKGARRLGDYVIELSAFKHPQVAADLSTALRTYVIQVASERGPGKTPWSHEERLLATCICRVLGRLRLQESVTALEPWMTVVRDDKLAVEAGLALCNTRLPEALPILLAAANRLGLNSPAWQQIDRDFARIAIPSDWLKEPRTAQGYHQRGLLQMARGNLKAASSDFTRAIELDPGQPEAYVSRALARSDLGALAGAERDLTSAIRLKATSLAYANRMNVRVKLRKLDEAVADGNRAIQLDPNNGLAYVNRSIARRLSGDLAGALSDCNRALRINPQDPAAYDHRGVARMAKGDLDGAIRDFTEAVRIDPGRAIAYSNRGMAKMEKGNLAGAIADFDTAIQRDPRCAQAFNNRGNAHLGTGELDRALADFGSAIRIDPTLPHPRVSRGIALRRKGMMEAAIAAFSRAIRVSPGFAYAYFQRGSAYQARHEFDRAISDYRHAVRSNPRYAMAHSNLGMLLSRRGDLDGALRAFDKAIQYNPNLFEAYVNRGGDRGRKGDLVGALADFDKAVKLKPGSWTAWRNRAMTLELIKRVKAAIASYQRAQQLAPADAQADLAARIRRLGGTSTGKPATTRPPPKTALEFYARGLRRQRERDTRGANADYTMAIKLDPKMVDAYLQRGVQRLAAKDYTGARADFDKMIALDPKHAKAYANRAIVFMLRREYKAALADTKKALQLEPTLWPAWLNQGLMLAKLGQRRAAIDSLKKAHEHAPAHQRAAISARLKRLGGATDRE